MSVHVHISYSSLRSSFHDNVWKYFDHYMLKILSTVTFDLGRWHSGHSQTQKTQKAQHHGSETPPNKHPNLKHRKPKLRCQPKTPSNNNWQKMRENIKNNLGKYIQGERSVRFRGFHIDLHVVILLLFFWWLQILAIRLKKVASDGFGVKVTGISSTLKRVRPPLKEEMDVNMDVNIQEGMWEKFVQ